LKVIEPLDTHVFAWVELVREFLDEGIKEYDWGVNEDDLHTTYHLWDKKNFGWLLEADGEIVGVLAGIAMPHSFNYSNRYFLESMWYVKKSHRGTGGGIMLYRACIKRCRELGISRVVFGHTKVMRKDFERLYKKLGFTYLESHYERVL